MGNRGRGNDSSRTQEEEHEYFECEILSVEGTVTMKNILGYEGGEEREKTGRTFHLRRQRGSGHWSHIHLRSTSPFMS